MNLNKHKNQKKTNFFSKLFSFRNKFNIFNFLTKTEHNYDYKKLEEKFITLDIGYKTTKKIIENLKLYERNNNIKSIKILNNKLKNILLNILNFNQEKIIQNYNKPYVILLVGVNGVGKTSTAVKLAYKYKSKNNNVILAAGDTFRAAAIDQLIKWANLYNITTIAQKQGADAASVIFDALTSAKAKNIDILIIDTAGRLQNKDFLMYELKKIIKVIKKIDIYAPHEIILVIDAITGQNSIDQANIFNKFININSLIITKLDGTAKGGIIFNILNTFKLPIRYISNGNKIEDLHKFSSNEFINNFLI